LSANGTKRPVRLCEQTRRFASESLDRKYGKMTKAVPAVCLDDVSNFESLGRLQRYDLAISRIVREAPLRVCEGELISGAATLGLAIEHRIPATYRGKAIYGSISHLTVDFETVLRHGVDHIRKNAEHTRLAEDCTIVCADFAEFLRQRRGREPFDIVFIDPPYGMRACRAAVEAILDNRLLKSHGVLVLESGEPDPLGVDTPLAAKFEVQKTARYGVAYVTILVAKK
jgi:hypothetical protein